MAQFRSVIRGMRGEASRLGSKQSGMSAHVDGWHTGATVRIDHIDGRDRVSVYRTAGSNSNGSKTLVAQWFAAESTAYPAQLKDAVDALVDEVNAR